MSGNEPVDDHEMPNTFRRLGDRNFLAAHSKEEIEALRAERSRYLEDREAPLVADLAAAGEPVSSVWDLVNAPRTYSKAIPVLLEHLRRPYPPPIRAGIGRALAAREARPYWPQLRDAYVRESHNGAKQGVACAVAATVTSQHFDEYAALLRDTTGGEPRALLVPALVSELGADPRVDPLLLVLSEDPFLAHEAKLAMRRRAKRAK